VGVTYYPDYQHAAYEGRDPLNRFDEEVVTADYFERTQTLLQMGDSHIVFRGGTGTISEFGMSWALSRIHVGHSIPLLLFGEFWGEITTCLRDHLYMREDEFHIYYVVTSPQDVLDTIHKLEQSKA
jgi:predicted Rossmann-fold nucleotide-binding protein